MYDHKDNDDMRTILQRMVDLSIFLWNNLDNNGNLLRPVPANMVPLLIDSTWVKDQLPGMFKRIDEFVADLETAEDNVTEAEEEAEKWETKFKELDKRNDELLAELDEANDRIRELEENISDREQECTELQAQIDELLSSGGN